MQTIFSQPGIHAIPMNDGAALMRDAFLSHRYWLFVVDNVGRPLINNCINAHYADAGAADDVRCVVTHRFGCAFAVIALRKRFMTARQLQQHLRAVGVHLSRREVAERDVFIAAAGNRLDQATALADEMMSDPVSPMVRASAPIDAGWPLSRFSMN